MRARWVELIYRSAHDAGLPTDPEFQAAFRSYIEWGSRVALENSQPEATPPPQMPMPMPMPMPKWWWVCDAKPGSRVSALEAAAEEPGNDVELPAPGQTVSFAEHIKPLFRERDRKSMKFAFDVWSYEDVRRNAAAIMEQVKAGTMPCDGTWPSGWVEAFERWTQTGMAAYSGTFRPLFAVTGAQQSRFGLDSRMDLAARTINRPSAS